MTHNAHQTRQDAPGWAILDPVRVRHFFQYYDGLNGRIGQKQQKVSNAVSQRETDICKAAECACVEALGDEPDVRLFGGSDGGMDGHLIDGRSIDVKAVAIRSNWEGNFGWNSIKSEDGRITADVLIAVKVTVLMDRAEAIGWAKRNDTMVPRRSFMDGRESYVLRPLCDLFPPGWLWQCLKCWQPTYLYVKGTDICPNCYS